MNSQDLAEARDWYARGGVSGDRTRARMEQRHAEICGCELTGCEFLAGWLQREKLLSSDGI